LKISKDGKTTNVTIRVTEELKERAEALWQEKYSTIPFNSFLSLMMDKGLKEERLWFDILAERDHALKNDVKLRTIRRLRDNWKTEGIPPEYYQPTPTDNLGKGPAFQHERLPKVTDIQPPAGEQPASEKRVNPIHDKDRA
jgi:antitoxin component of RelBE/YafQ-DinJ toxin-antitoxin module